MPTLVGLRRRGYTPEAIRLFCRAHRRHQGRQLDRLLGRSRIALRDDLEGKAPRAMAVLDPLKLVLDNWAEVFGSDEHLEPCSAPAHPQQPDSGSAQLPLGREVWIEREDFMETPPKGYFRLFPGNKVRLKYGYVVECTGCEKDDAGQRRRGAWRAGARHQERHAGRRRGEGQGHDHLGRRARRACAAEVRLYDRLFTEPQPDAGGTRLPRPRSTRTA